jgi:hypothetical protein
MATAIKPGMLWQDLPGIAGYQIGKLPMAKREITWHNR